MITNLRMELFEALVLTLHCISTDRLVLTVDEVPAGVPLPPRPQLRQVLHEAALAVDGDGRQPRPAPSHDHAVLQLYGAGVTATCPTFDYENSSV